MEKGNLILDPQKDALLAAARQMAQSQQQQVNQMAQFLMGATVAYASAMIQGALAGPRNNVDVSDLDLEWFKPAVALARAFAFETLNELGRPKPEEVDPEKPMPTPEVILEG